MVFVRGADSQPGTALTGVDGSDHLPLFVVVQLRR